MADETETAWDEINPPMVSARPQGPLATCSERLQPASTEQFRNELTACLALVAPVGMTEEATREWLAIAWRTLNHLPADLLAKGCAAARLKCDHPAKIVPTIVEETRVWMKSRHDALRDAEPRQALPSPDYCTPEQARAILEEFKLNKRVEG